MASYFLAPSLVALRNEVNAMFPNRDHSSDGWIGNASHAARKSDHNPDWDAPGKRRGIVRAEDIDIGPDGRGDLDLRDVLLKALIGDPRVYYVISNRRIYSRTYGWASRPYTGVNPHDHHVHVSIRSTPEAESDTRPWLTTTTAPEDDMTSPKHWDDEDWKVFRSRFFGLIVTKGGHGVGYILAIAAKKLGVK